MKRHRPAILALAALLAFGATAEAADGRASDRKAAAAAGANASGELQKLKNDFNSRRDRMLAERQALLDQLKNATAEERKALLDKWHADMKGRIDEQRALGKRIRDEMRKMRQHAPPGRR